MTNPFAVMVLHAIDTYHKYMTSLPEKHTLPKALFYTLGTTIIASVIYKSLKNTRNTHISNFLSTFMKYNIPILQNSHAHPHPEYDSIAYEDKYFKEYDEWLVAGKSATDATDATDATATAAEEAHKKECLENMYHSTIRETINDFYGDVIMCYDHATLSFAYYARTGNIPYKYLETISRKYMIETNAPRDIHVDIRSEYNKAKNKNNTTNKIISSTPVTAATTATSTSTSTATATSTTTTSTATTTPVAEEVDVFAKLKSYNNASNLNTYTTNDTKDKTHKFVNEQQDANTNTNTNTNTDTKILRENANRYSYRGKIADFAEHHKAFLAHRRATTDAVSIPSAFPSQAQAQAPDAPQSYAEYKKKIAKL